MPQPIQPLYCNLIRIKGEAEVFPGGRLSTRRMCKLLRRTGNCFYSSSRGRPRLVDSALGPVSNVKRPAVEQATPWRLRSTRNLSREQFSPLPELLHTLGSSAGRAASSGSPRPSLAWSLKERAIRRAQQTRRIDPTATTIPRLKPLRMPLCESSSERKQRATPRRTNSPANCVLAAKRTVPPVSSHPALLQSSPRRRQCLARGRTLGAPGHLYVRH